MNYEYTEKKTTFHRNRSIIIESVWMSFIDLRDYLYKSYTLYCLENACSKPMWDCILIVDDEQGPYVPRDSPKPTLSADSFHDFSQKHFHVPRRKSRANIIKMAVFNMATIKNTKIGISVTRILVITYKQNSISIYIIEGDKCDAFNLYE